MSASVVHCSAGGQSLQDRRASICSCGLVADVERGCLFPENEQPHHSQYRGKMQLRSPRRLIANPNDRGLITNCTLYRDLLFSYAVSIHCTLTTSVVGRPPLILNRGICYPERDDRRNHRRAYVRQRRRAS